MANHRKCGRWAGAALLLALAQFAASAQLTLYSTHFEQSEGFDPAFTLAGQDGWISFGSGGNGLINELIEGHGQQAYIGFHPPTEADEFTSVWRPLDFVPVPGGANVIKFSVLLDFEPSTAGGNDDFRWSIYNAQGTRLFSIDFETSTTLISYLLEDGVFKDTGWTFSFDGVYTLIVWMDFERNLWTATLNDIVIVNSQPLTQNDAELSFGDADAVWSIRDLSAPGDNFMVFDDYLVTAEPYNEIPPILEPAGFSEGGHFQFLIHGQEELEYSVEVTNDFQTWFSLGNFAAPAGGTFLFEDTTSQEYQYGFYRVGPSIPQ